MRYALLLLLLVGCGGGGTSAPSGVPGTYEVRIDGSASTLRYGTQYFARVWRTDGVAAAVDDVRIETNIDTFTVDNVQMNGGSLLRIKRPSNANVILTGKVFHNGAFVQVTSKTLPLETGPVFRCDVTLTYNGAPAEEAKVALQFPDFATDADHIGADGQVSKDCPMNTTGVLVQPWESPIGKLSKLVFQGVTYNAGPDGILIPVPTQAPGDVFVITATFTP